MSNAKKIHNPKAHTPAVYIPCWLVQVSIQLLSLGAKTLYGRLAQWSNSTGQVYRTSHQLGLEIGTSYRSIENYLKELRDVELIGTFQQEKGGVNHYQFYDHPWMHEPIIDELIYKQDPPQDSVVPPTGSCGRVPQDPVAINKKEIKEIKSINNISATSKKLVDAEKPKTKQTLNIDDLKNDNPHNIHEEVLEDWLEVRKTKRSPVTKTAWSRINIELCKYMGDKIEAFETMVERGWTGFKADWMANTNNKSITSANFDHQSTKWAEPKFMEEFYL